MTTNIPVSPPTPNSGGAGVGRVGTAPRGRPSSHPGPDPAPLNWGGGTSLAWTALSGLLLAGALPHLDWGWLAWIGLVPFLRLFPLRRGRTAFWHGFTLGVFYLGGMAYWVGVFAAHLISPALSVVGWALVTAYQAFYLGVWALGAQWLRQRPNPWAWRLGVPALWAVVEWWRQSGTLALGWGDLAYTQHFALPILQVTKMTGIWGLAFLIVLVNVALAEVIAPRQAGNGDGLRAGAARPADRLFPLLTAALLATTLLYGFLTIRSERLRPTFVAAALQGNINQNVNQDPAYQNRVLQTFEGQGRVAAAHEARLVVWPETAFPGYLQTGFGPGAQVAAEAVRNKQTILVGAVEYDARERKNANSLFLMDLHGNVTGSYQKRQLVPFGEFTPGRRGVPFLESLHVTTFDMKRGADRQPLLDGGPIVGKIGTVLCFESSYPRLTQEQVKRGAGLLVVSTDDAWFGRTAAARQHSAIAAVRAAESDRYLVRSAATGVSQVIDPTGRVLTEAGLFQKAVVWAPVESRATITPSVRWGDWFVGFCAVLLAAVSVRVRRAGTSHSSGR